MAGFNDGILAVGRRYVERTVKSADKVGSVEDLLGGTEGLVGRVGEGGRDAATEMSAAAAAQRRRWMTDVLWIKRRAKRDQQKNPGTDRGEVTRCSSSKLSNHNNTPVWAGKST